MIRKIIHHAALAGLFAACLPGRSQAGVPFQAEWGGVSAWWPSHWLLVVVIGLVSITGYLLSRRQISNYRKQNLQLEHGMAQREQAEAAMRLSEARFQGFVRNSSEVIWCVEFDPPVSLAWSEEEQLEGMYRGARLVEANKMYAAITGMTVPRT